MNLFQAIFLGIIEGLTEFLPISSTFHLIWFAKILGITQTDFTKLFEVFIQSGAILSVIFLYFKTIKTNKELMKKTLIAFVPTAIIGFLLFKVIKDVFFNADNLMLFVFIAVGILFIIYEFILKNKNIKLVKSLENFSYKQAIFVGLMQSLAVFPGVSRAGGVMIALMFLNFRRDEAAKFSFLLAVPTIFAASFYDLFKMRKLVIGYLDHSLLLAVGFISAFISAYFVMKWFITYLQKHSLSGFGWYRIVAGLTLILFGIK